MKAKNGNNFCTSGVLPGSSPEVLVFRKYFGSTWEVLWKYFGSTLEVVWKYFGSTLVVLWKYFGSTLEVIQR